MPRLDGIEITRRIREKYGDQVVVIMISVADWKQIEDTALDAGVNRFISKPLFPFRIIDCINECMGQRTEKEPQIRRLPDSRLKPRESIKYSDCRDDR